MLTKPTPQIIAAEFLTDDLLNDFTDFLTFLQTNKLKPHWIAKNAWEVKIKNFQILRRLRINSEHKNWSINLHFYNGYNEHIINDEFKEFIWANLCQNICHNNANCRHYSTIQFFGKNFTKMCCCGQITISNPTGKEMEFSKELILITKTIVEKVILEDAEKPNKRGYLSLISGRHLK